MDQNKRESWNKTNGEMQQKVREQAPSIPGVVMASFRVLQGNQNYQELKPAV